jgi:plastocyanin
MKALSSSLIVFLSAGFGGLLLFSCNNSGNNATKPSAKAYTIVIQQMKFTPAELTVNMGDTVTWTNNDILEHNVTEERNKAWSSSKLSAGKSWSKVIQNSADYYCSIHPVMKGSLKVR